MLLRLLLLFVVSNIVVSQSIIKTLPGFFGELPFKLETGYIGVGDLDEVQLFYYFIESERSPKDDPLVLWLTGGPGCSGFSGLVYEIGPLCFNYANFSGTKPTFVLNPYSWTKISSIIFLDAPVGTGFSYATSSEAYKIGDVSSAAQTYEFLRKWLIHHPKFLTNPLYIAGDSYSGMIVPIIVQEVSNGKEVGHEPPMKLQGYILGNPFTDIKYDLNSRIIFAHRKALLSNELYKSTKRNCNGEYMRPDPSNAACIDDLEVVNKCLEKVNMAQILEPKCSTLSPIPNRSQWDQSSLGENSMDGILSTPQLPGPWCRNYNYLLSYMWANDKTVQSALHVREGTIKEWARCNTTMSLSYAHDVITSIEYERNLTKKDYRALIYSGDHDMVIPYIGTQEWIESLGLPITTYWEPWFVDGQIAGYTMEYTMNKYTLRYVTVKGAGHTAPEYKPKQCLAMLNRWFAYYPL